MLEQDYSFLQFLSYLAPGNRIWFEDATLHIQASDAVTAGICWRQRWMLAHPVIIWIPFNGVLTVYAQTVTPA